MRKHILFLLFVFPVFVTSKTTTDIVQQNALSIGVHKKVDELIKDSVQILNHYVENEFKLIQKEKELGSKVLTSLRPVREEFIKKIKKSNFKKRKSEIVFSLSGVDYVVSFRDLFSAKLVLNKRPIPIEELTHFERINDYLKNNKITYEYRYFDLFINSAYASSNIELISSILGILSLNVQFFYKEIQALRVLLQKELDECEGLSYKKRQGRSTSKELLKLYEFLQDKNKSAKEIIFDCNKVKGADFKQVFIEVCDLESRLSECLRNSSKKISTSNSERSTDIKPSNESSADKENEAKSR